MALLKEKEDKKGITSNYHRLQGVEINFDAQRVTCFMESYVDEEKRQDNKGPIETIQLDISKDDKVYDKVAKITKFQELLYKLLKENAEFIDSKDC